jgi:hypothetical protein
VFSEDQKQSARQNADCIDTLQYARDLARATAQIRQPVLAESSA